jgi:hypothetical protein
MSMRRGCVFDRAPGIVRSRGSEHPVGVGTRDVPSEQRRRVLRVSHELQSVPVLDRLALGVHPVDVDPGDPGVLRVVV